MMTSADSLRHMILHYILSQLAMTCGVYISLPICLHWLGSSLQNRIQQVNRKRDHDLEIETEDIKKSTMMSHQMSLLIT